MSCTTKYFMQFILLSYVSCYFFTLFSPWNPVLHSLSSLHFLFHLISFLSKNNGFRAKMYGTLKIDLFIRYNFCKTYFFPRSIFNDIKWKNLLKTFFISFDLENQICGYFYHHIRNKRLKIRWYSEFQNYRMLVLFGSLSHNSRSWHSRF